jgi:hypothetical protein
VLINREGVFMVNVQSFVEFFIVLCLLWLNQYQSKSFSLVRRTVNIWAVRFKPVYL